MAAITFYVFVNNITFKVTFKSDYTWILPFNSAKLAVSPLLFLVLS